MVSYWDKTMYILDGEHPDILYFSSSLDAERINLETYTLSDAFPVDSSQSWTQIQQSIYFMYFRYEGNDIKKIDLLTTNVAQIAEIEVTTEDLPCLTNNNTHLFIHLAFTIWTYHIDSAEFTGNYSVSVRNGANCQIYQNKLYLFGGYNDSHDALDTIYEYDTELNTLHLIDTTLNEPATEIRSIQQNQFIYLFGGHTKDYYSGSVTVQIFNAIQQTIFTTPDHTFYRYLAGYFDADKDRKIMIDTNYMYSVPG